MKKCKLYLLGLPNFKLIVDHQPLVSILDRYTLDAVENPRSQRMKERLSPFTFETVWRKGSEHAIPDALSRAPVSDPTAEDLESEADIFISSKENLKVRAIELQDADESAADHLSDPIIEQLRTVADLDQDYQALIKAVMDGFKMCQADANPFVKQFWSNREELSVTDGLVLFESRLVIPAAARRDVLAKLHASHQGVERTRRRARQSVFWPGINADISNTVGACAACQERLPSHPPEPMMSDPMPSRVFEDVSADLFSHAGKHFLVYADRLSGWPVIDSWTRDPSSREVIRIIARNFVNLGVPVRIRSDGGPQFDSKEYKDFLERWGVKQGLSTPHYAQSNGHAEAAVKAMKALVAKLCTSGDLEFDKFRHALLEFRNTPGSDGRSPAQVVFGHNLRSSVPAHRKSFAPEWQADGNLRDERAALEHEKVRTHYNKRARKLHPLGIGTTVRVQNHSTKLWDRVGIIVAVGRFRDYRIKFPSGSVLWRNRRFLRPASGSDPEPSSSAETAPPSSSPTPVPVSEKPSAPAAAPRRSERKKTPKKIYDARVISIFLLFLLLRQLM